MSELSLKVDHVKTTGDSSGNGSSVLEYSARFTLMINKCLLFLCLTFPLFAQASSKIIRVNDFSDPNASYAIEMLKLALSHIEESYEIEISKSDFTQARVNEEIRSRGILDLGWTSFDAAAEETVLPIRIPLFKGLLGYRILIINKHDQAKFDQIKTLEELKKLSFGQGRTWADTRILEANGFNIVKTNKYSGLFYMTEGGRFDGFPRGVHEPFGELAKRPDMELAVEKNLMIVYRMPFYLFVAKENKELAANIELGLNRAIADGSFDQVFQNAPSVKDVKEKVNMKQRRVFYIDNPTLSKATPLDRAELWIDPEKDF
jgi:hypothetical protein